MLGYDMGDASPKKAVRGSGSRKEKPSEETETDARLKLMNINGAPKLFIEFTINCYYVVTRPTAVFSLFNKGNTLSYFFIWIFIGN